MPYRIIGQLPTKAVRIRAAAFRRVVHGSPVLFERVATYSSVVVTQLAQSALCARFHTARQRLSRWLATAASRADEPRIPWSHEWIAEIVGGPRCAVSQAAASLRDQGLIQYGRQGVVITDLRGLRRESCECLHIVERAIRELSARKIPDR
jgi:CRP-like cAMP-binding protein